MCAAASGNQFLLSQLPVAQLRFETVCRSLPLTCQRSCACQVFYSDAKGVLVVSNGKKLLRVNPKTGVTSTITETEISRKSGYETLFRSKTGEMIFLCFLNYLSLSIPL